MQHRHHRPARPSRSRRSAPPCSDARPTVSRRLQVVSGVVGLVALTGFALPLPARATAPVVLSTYLGVPGVPGADAQGQPPARTHLSSPAGLATDTAGDLYVADPAAHDVVEVVGTHAWVVAGIAGVSGQQGDVDPGVATARALVTPTGLAVLPDGSLLVADPGAHVVWRLLDGALSVFAGTGADAPAADGVATAEPLEAPTGLAVDPGGTVYVSDRTDETVWSVSGGILSHLAGLSGAAGYAGDGGSADQVRFDHPSGLTWSAPPVYDASARRSGRLVAGHLLVADTGNGRVRGVSGDGATGVAAGPIGLSAPSGLLATSDGSVLVADSGDGRVLRLAGGSLTVLAGTGADGLSGDGTPVATASLAQPTGLAVVSPGRFLVSEAAGAVVRSVGPALAAPAEPAAPQVVAGDGRATVAWAAPDDGGSPITGYALREYAASGASTSITVVGSTSITVQGLSDGQPYRFTVAAVNAYGTSPESPVSATVVPDPPRAGGTAIPPAVVPSTPAPSATPTTAAPVPSHQPLPAVTAAAAPTRASVAPIPIVTPTPTPMPSIQPSRVQRAAPAVVAPQPTPKPPVARTTPPATSTAAPAELVPVHSFADAATDVVTVTRKTAIPLVLVALLVAFLLLQGFLDRRDRTLSLSPLHGDPGLDFEAV